MEAKPGLGSLVLLRFSDGKSFERSCGRSVLQERKKSMRTVIFLLLCCLFAQFSVSVKSLCAFCQCSTAILETPAEE